MRYMNPSPNGACRRQACVQHPPVSACQRDTSQCEHLPVMAFVPPQTWEIGCVYTCGQALTRGTLFPSLDKPFMGKGGCCNG